MAAHQPYNKIGGRKMQILVIGGTGTVGSHVVQGLLNRGIKTRCLVRSEEKARKLPTNVNGRIGDLDKPETLSAAFEGIDGVFMLFAVSRHETEQGLAATETLKKAKVGKIVYMSVRMPEDSKHIPHFKSKIPIENAIKNSGIPYTILRPNMFFQNLHAVKDVVMSDHIYPFPIGSKGMSQIDVRDIADAAINALIKPGFEGQEINLSGPAALTGAEAARILSQAMEREIRYCGDDLDEWENQARQMLPEWMAHDFRIMYEYFQKKGMVASLVELGAQQEIVGHPPRSFDAFAKELFEMWIGKTKAMGG